jgi:hypothetical protein
MKHLVLYLLLAPVILTSCGVSYKPLTLEKLSYQNSAPLKENVTVSYVYDVQTATKNKRYAKKERKSGFTAIAVRIKNDSDQPIVLTDDNLIVSVTGGLRKFPLTVATYTDRVMQHPPVHLLHALWGPWQFSYWEDGNGNRTSSFKYIPVGAAVGIINLIIAANGNKRHKEEMSSHQLYGKTVKPGETANGIIILPMPGYEPLTFELKE